MFSIGSIVLVSRHIITCAFSSTKVSRSQGLDIAMFSDHFFFYRRKASYIYIYICTRVITKYRVGRQYIYIYLYTHIHTSWPVLQLSFLLFFLIFNCKWKMIYIFIWWIIILLFRRSLISVKVLSISWLEWTNAEGIDAFHLLAAKSLFFML